MKGNLIVTGLLSALIGAGVALAVSASTPVGTSDKAAIEKIVREYILAHPEVLTEAMENLQTRQVAAAVEANRKTIETPFGKAWEGATDADVTLVQFFDYSCTYCRASLPVIDKLLAEDKKLRIVYRELPVLGEASLDAAKVSLAVARGGGDYGAFHRAVYGGGRITPATLAAARKAGNADKIDSEAPAIREELARNLNLQQELGLTGTPSWVVGDEVLSGAVGYDRLKEAIAKAREKRSG